MPHIKGTTKVGNRLYLDHSIVGSSALTNFEEEFRRDRPFTFCRICGKVFQPWLDRVKDTDYDKLVMWAAEIERREWSQNHARTHTSQEHKSLQDSGNFLTPEATHKLVPYGIAPIQDMVFSEEHSQAAREAPRAPLDTPETTVRR
jgi:hypothetical protein